jgi:tetratricopeptide (TPR) repeat protein
MDAAVAANLRGVGLMEQHRFADAQREFEEAARLAPDWLTAQINLGIAMLNQQPADTKELSEQVKKSREVFHRILERDLDNPYAHYCLGMLDLYLRTPTPTGSTPPPRRSATRRRSSSTRMSTPPSTARR